MNEHQLVSAIAGPTGIDDVAHRHDAVQATLHVLGERIPAGVDQDVALLLPRAFSDALRSGSAGQLFGVGEFYERVAVAEGRGCTPDQARAHARAVVAALKVGLPESVLDELVSQLPDDYGDLLAVG